MFLSPLFGLGNQIHRDISGMGFGLNFPGKVMAQMLFASGAAAVGIATGPTDGNQTGGQHWAFGLELFLAGLQGAADQGRVFGNFHVLPGQFSKARTLNSIAAYQLQG